MDIRSYNSRAWDEQVKKGNRWTQPVSSETIDLARQGKFEIVLTPSKPVPGDWFPPLADCRTLCLAGGGGQQSPVLAAAGAKVTVLDNSQKQLEQDRLVAQRDDLKLVTVHGDMGDLYMFRNDSFDLIFHPCSNTFVPDVQPVWNEAFRVLKPGGTLLAGMCNPVVYIFDYEKYQAGEFVVRHSLPYSDLDSLSEQERQQLFDGDEPLCFSHSLESQIGGQLQAGFRLVGFYEDFWGDDADSLLDKIMPGFFATRAEKPS